MKENITVVIHSYNSADHIEECIQSAKLLTSQIHVFDMRSTDATVVLAKAAGAVVYSVPRYSYVEPVREEGIRSATTSWVFLLDTDERITPESAQEIAAIISNIDENDLKTGCYKIPRKNIFARYMWLQHGGWWPDYQTRLISLSHFRTWPKQIHATPVIEGTVGLLHQPMIHYFHGDIEGMVEKTIVFEDIESDLLYKADRPVNVPTFFRKFAGELFRRLVRAQGYRDGMIGIIESIYQAYSKTITYLYLYEKKKSRTV